MKTQSKINTVKSFSFLLVSIIFIFNFTILLSGCSTLSKRKHYNPELGNRIVDIAAKYKGTPYKYRGTTPAGFDCSGYSSYVYKKAGIEIPRTTSLQYSSGSSVAKSDLKKGDLVFFMGWPIIGMILPPNHVGIYVGNNRFIHAPSSGGKVRHDSLNNSYWNNRFKGARDLTGAR
jgi:cell wall-associated NlpC family hydrolase